MTKYFGKPFIEPEKLLLGDQNNIYTPNIGPIHPFKYESYPFIRYLIAKQAFGNSDPNNLAAKQYLQDHFQYSEDETKSYLDHLATNNSPFWQSFFSNRQENEKIPIGETAAGYLWRLYRKDQTKYEKKRDFLILMLVEYSKDDDQFATSELLNDFIREVNSLDVDLSVENLQLQFWEAEVRQQQEKAEMTEEKKREPVKPFDTQQNVVDDQHSNSQHKLKLDDIQKDGPLLDKEVERKLAMNFAEDRLIQQHTHYMSAAYSAKSNISIQLDSNATNPYKASLKDNENRNRFERYLYNIILQQVKYNYLQEQNLPFTPAEFSQNMPLIESRMADTEGGRKTQLILGIYRMINKKFGVSQLAFSNQLSPDDDSNTLERDNENNLPVINNDKQIAEQAQKHIKMIPLLKFQKEIRLDYGQFIVDGEIPHDFYLSNEILNFLVTARPEQVNEDYVNSLINENKVDGLSGFRDFNKYIPSNFKGAEEYRQVREYLGRKAELKNAYANANKLLGDQSKELIPIKAVILPNEINEKSNKTVPIELRLYLQKEAENTWKLIDMTNPLEENPLQPSESGKSDGEAIEKVIKEFSEIGTNYVPGKLIVELPSKYFDTKKMIEFDYSGKNGWSEWSEWMQTVSGFLNTFGTVLRFIPHPIAQGLSKGAMLVAQVTNGAAAAIDISNRVQAGTFRWDLETVGDAVDIVSGTAGIGVVAAPAKNKLVKSFFSTIEGGTEIGGYILIPLELNKQIEKIRKDPTKTDAEKNMLINELIKTTAWETGKEVVIDKVSSSVGDRFMRLKERNNVISGITESKGKSNNKEALPNIEITYAKLNKGEVAKVNSKIQIVLNKDISLNRKKRFDKAIREEKAHIWVKIFHAVEPELYNETIGAVKKTNEFKEFKNSPLGRAYKEQLPDEVKKNTDILDDYLAEEFLGKVLYGEYSSLTSKDSAVSKVYKRLIEFIDSLMSLLGIQDETITHDQLLKIVKSGKDQLSNNGKVITYAASKKLTDFFDGNATIDINILGQTYKNAKLHKDASREVLFREMYQLTDPNKAVQIKKDKEAIKKFFSIEVEIEDGISPQEKIESIKPKPSTITGKVNPEFQEQHEEIEAFFAPITFAEEITDFTRPDFLNFIKVHDNELTNSIVGNLVNHDKTLDQEKLLGIVKVAIKHLFATEHLIVVKDEAGTTKWVRARFTPNKELIALFIRISKQTVEMDESDFDSFISLVSHEYMESKLMESGLLFRGPNEGDPMAHNLSINEDKFSFDHYDYYNYQDHGLNKSKLILQKNLSNIDVVIAEIINQLNTKK